MIALRRAVGLVAHGIPMCVVVQNFLVDVNTIRWGGALNTASQASSGPVGFQSEGATMNNSPPDNRGEGDPEAAKRFNDAERQFVDSPLGKQAVRAGAQVRPEEEADLANAERLAKERARGSIVTPMTKEGG